MSRFEGKIIIVSGASIGIGKETAMAFAEEGGKVVLFSRNKNKLSEIAERINNDTSGEAYVFSGDITKINEIRSLFKAVMEKYSKVDILVNCTGQTVHKSITEVKEEEWDNIINTNLKGFYFTCQEAAQVMLKNKYGKIINVSSTFGAVGFAGATMYCSSKGGVTMLTKSLAVELAPNNINVNEVCPAATMTESRALLFSNEEFLNRIISKIPKGRIAETNDIAKAILFLASEEADFITGASLFVDGGYTAQ